MANRYYKGGNWSNINSWSATVDGAGGASVPTSSDNVYWNSAPDSATYTVDVTAYCLDMDWTGATNNPRLTHSAQLNIYGAYTGIVAMTHTGGSALYFRSNNQTVNITLGTTLSCDIAFGDESPLNLATWTLTDALNIGAQTIYHISGTLITSGMTITCGNFYSGYTYTRVLTLGASVVNCTAWTFPTTAGLTLTANTATIKVTGTGVFTGGGLTYYEVQLNGTAHTISGSNTFTNLILKADTTQTITFTDGTTQTITTPNITGSIGKVKTLQGSSTGGWAISKASGRVVCDYLSVSYSTASGGAAFYAGGNSTDGGNNTGWMFAKAVVSGMTKARVLSLVLWKR